jgi:hypothetical protein
MIGLSPPSDPANPSHDRYDERYLAGIVHFNRAEYFEAHEVWEDIWMDCLGADRRFYQSLIQAAVALYHWGNGNRAGAVRLFASGRRYMEPYRPVHRGLDVNQFWGQVEAALAPALSGEPSPDPALRADAGEGHDIVPDRPPMIALNPPPDLWPEPQPPDLPPTAGVSHE